MESDAYDLDLDEPPSISSPVPLDPWVLASLHHRQLHAHSETFQLHDGDNMELEDSHCSLSGGNFSIASSSQNASRLEPDIAKKAFHVTCRDDLTVCALRDGSSYVCPRCQGVVQISRRSQHIQYWCQPPHHHNNNRVDDSK